MHWNVRGSHPLRGRDRSWASEVTAGKGKKRRPAPAGGVPAAVLPECNVAVDQRSLHGRKFSGS